MIIALSSAAAPSASLEELVEAAARRGLSAVHLVDGHQHGLTPASTEIEIDEALATAGAMQVEIAAFETSAATDRDEVARVCRRLGARHITQSVVLDASRENVSDALAALLSLHPALDYITLRGGGPGGAQFEGRGIGAMMARLARMNYRGVLALAPSSEAVLPVWRVWLGRGRNWGCGSKAADPSLVQLGS
jgi:hypothetical protein